MTQGTLLLPFHHKSCLLLKAIIGICYDAVAVTLLLSKSSVGGEYNEKHDDVCCCLLKSDFVDCSSACCEDNYPFVWVLIFFVYLGRLHF